MTGNIVSLVDQIGGTDFGMTKPQMGHGYTAGFFGVICKITLCIHISVITDNFDCVFIGTNSTVRTITPELAADGAFCGCYNRSANRQAHMGYIIYDTNSKAIHWFFCCQIFINSD